MPGWSKTSWRKSDYYMLIGGMFTLYTGVILYLDISKVECGNQPVGSIVCTLVHPLWPLALLPIGAVLMGYSLWSYFHHLNREKMPT